MTDLFIKIELRNGVSCFSEDHFPLGYEKNGVKSFFINRNNITRISTDHDLNEIHVELTNRARFTLSFEKDVINEFHRIERELIYK